MSHNAVKPSESIESPASGSHRYACTVCGTILSVVLRAAVPYCSLDSCAGACVHCVRLSNWLALRSLSPKQSQ